MSFQLFSGTDKLQLFLFHACQIFDDDFVCFSRKTGFPMRYMEQRGNQIIRADVFIQKTTYSDFSCFMPIYRKIIPVKIIILYPVCFQQVGGSLKAIGIAEISEVNIHQHNVNVIFRNDAF